MAKDDAMGLNEAFLVTRSVPLVGEPELGAVADALAGLPGVAYSRPEEKGGLEIRYDASRLGFDEIEGVLDEAGIARPDSMWWRIKSEWFRFTDGNARSNAHAVHACCSRPPVAPGSKKSD